MTVALPQDDSSSTYVLRGPGWTAEVFSTESIVLCTSPDGDELPAAISAILTRRRRPYWTVQHSHVNAFGWDVWNLEREAEHSVTI